MAKGVEWTWRRQGSGGDGAPPEPALGHWALGLGALHFNIKVQLARDSSAEIERGPGPPLLLTA